MGDFSAGEFEWHADAAFFRPDFTEILDPRTGLSRPGKQPELPAGMDDDALVKTEFFKAALFELVMRRAQAFMEATKQKDLIDEKKRYAVVNLQIHMDTQVHPDHDKPYEEGGAPVGFDVLRKATYGMFPALGVRVVPEWSDSKASLLAANALITATLGCHKVNSE